MPHCGPGFMVAPPRRLVPDSCAWHAAAAAAAVAAALAATTPGKEEDFWGAELVAAGAPKHPNAQAPCDSAYTRPSLILLLCGSASAVGADALAACSCCYWPAHSLHVRAPHPERATLFPNQSLQLPPAHWHLFSPATQLLLLLH